MVTQRMLVVDFDGGQLLWLINDADDVNDG